jgi:8-oxo-dGTP pyrophosphatase MutT (NUDIX family)
VNPTPASIDGHIEAARRALVTHAPRALDDGLPRRQAAVLLLLHPLERGAEILFQVRTNRVRFHKGEISLPGGGIDADDASALHAALRETHEEIGVHPGHVEVLGSLDQIATRSSNYLITPFVGVISAPTPYEFALANREVAELLTVPVASLLDERAVRWAVTDVDGERGAEREYHYGEHRIWGATARILASYFDLLAGLEGRA